MYRSTKMKTETHELIKKYCQGNNKGKRKNMIDVIDAMARQYIGEATDNLKGVFALVVPTEKQLIIDGDYTFDRVTDVQYELMQNIEFDGDVVIRLDKTLVLYGDIDVKGNVLSNNTIYVKGNITAGRSVMCAKKIYCDGRISAREYFFSEGFNARP